MTRPAPQPAMPAAARCVGIDAPVSATSGTTAVTRARTPWRIQRQRTKGWRMPPDAVYVGRPSLWGNPWRVGDGPLAGPPGSPYADALFYLDDLLVVGAFERLTVPSKIAADPDWLAPLRGKDLACWCPLDQPCHANVLLELANP